MSRGISAPENTATYRGMAALSRRLKREPTTTVAGRVVESACTHIRFRGGH